MFRGANATKQPMGAGNASSDQHVVDGVFCMWLQPMCPRSWWNGGRQAPCSLVLMPSTSPLWAGTCQQWPTWEMFRGANATNQPMSIDEHGVDVVFCSCLQPAHLVIAEVSQAPMGWWKASTMFFGADAFNQPIGAWNMSAVTNMG